MADAATAPVWPRRLAWTGLLLASACGVVELIAGPGYRFGWWGLGTGLKVMQWGAIFAAAAVLIALVATGLAWRARDAASRRTALAGLLLSMVVIAPPALMLNAVMRLPHIHDISTDTEHPPSFVAVVPLRRDARNPMSVDPATIAQQKQGYPDLHPAQLAVPPTEALRRAERIARAMGWDIVAVSPADGRLEATATTLLFGFKDDVVVRVTPQGAGSRVDVRSLSRIGGSDLGANAKRVRAFVDKLESDTEA